MVNEEKMGLEEGEEGDKEEAKDDNAGSAEEGEEEGAAA
jgi:hypothetical protein